MPTATTIEGKPLYNLGPLTSTWSAPSSCATSGFNTALAFSVYEDDGVFVENYLDCREDRWDHFDECFPDGAEFLSMVTSDEEKPEPTYGGHFYHSPGLQCPEGWITAGAATMKDDDKVEKTGDLFDTYETMSVDDIYYKPYAQVLADALDAGETAIWCCPSDYKVDKLVEGCYKTLDASSFTVTDFCSDILVNSLVQHTDTFTVDGTVLTRSDFLTWTGHMTWSAEVQRTTIGPDELEDAGLTPVVYYPLITMAHKEGDRDDGGNEGNDDGSSGNGSGSGDGNDNNNDNDEDDDSGNDNSDGDNDGDGANGDNAAVRLVDAGFMAAIVGAAGVLGAAFML